MADARKRYRQLEGVARLQSLRAMASGAEFADARADHCRAETHLQECEETLGAEAGRLNGLLSADSLDLEGWRIGLAMLDEAERARRIAMEGMATTAAREAAGRDAWFRDCRLEERARESCRGAARRIAAKHDNASTQDAIELELARGKKGTA